MDMDDQDEHSGKFEEYHEQLQSAAYCQFKSVSKKSSTLDDCENGTLEVINERLRSSYCSFKSTTLESPLASQLEQSYNGGHDRLQHPEDTKPGNAPRILTSQSHALTRILTVRSFNFAVNQFSPSPNRFVPQSPGQTESEADA